MSLANIADGDEFSELYKNKTLETETAFYNVLKSLDPSMPLTTGVSDLTDAEKISDLGNLEDLGALWETVKIIINLSL